MRSRGVPGVILAVATACSQQHPPNSVVIHPPSAQSAVVPVTHDQNTYIALDAIRPLSASRNFAQISQLVAQRSAPQAVAAVAQVLATLDPNDPELPRWHLYLGYAYRREMEFAQALAHFSSAAGTKWPLTEYAQFGAAQALLSLGRLNEALLALDEIQAEPPLSQSVNLLRAQIWSQTGQLQRAIPVWRDYLATTPTTDPERSRTSLLLAESLISIASKQDGMSFEPLQPRLLDGTLKEAFERLEPSVLRGLDVAGIERAAQLRRSLVGILMAGEPVAQEQCVISDQLGGLELLVEQRQWLDAQPIAESLVAQMNSRKETYSRAYCRVVFALAQILQARGKGDEAAVRFDEVADHCLEPEDLVARALFQSTRRDSQQHNWPRVIARSEALQSRFPHHRLADDARLRAANAYLELGSESKFIELILKMPEDFEAGDQVPEAMFGLVLRRLTRGDWSGAAAVLSAMSKVPSISQQQDAEQAERWMYFSARVKLQLGQRDQALELLERIVRLRPYSYYMLLARSQLEELAPERLQLGVSDGLRDAVLGPFQVPYRPELDVPGFARALQLMAVSEVSAGNSELRQLGLNQEVESQLLWAKAYFESASGNLKASQRIVRERFAGWTRFWPTGAWTGGWTLAFPRPYLEIVQSEARRAGVPVPLVYAIMREESMFDQRAVSSADAHGLMQLILPTAQRAAKEVGLSVSAAALKRPEVNITLGCQVLKDLRQRFPRHPVAVIAGYNAGPGRPIRWLKERPDMDFDIWVENIPITETRTYVKHVLASWATYAWLYSRDDRSSDVHITRRISP